MGALSVTVISMCSVCLTSVQLPGIGIGAGAAGRLTIDGKRRSYVQLKSPAKWEAAVSEKRTGIAEEAVLSDAENLQVRSELCSSSPCFF